MPDKHHGELRTVETKIDEDGDLLLGLVFGPYGIVNIFEGASTSRTERWCESCKEWKNVEADDASFGCHKCGRAW